MEAECVVDERVFAGISNANIPELRKKTEGRIVKDADAGDGVSRFHKNTGRKATGSHLSTLPKTMAGPKLKPRTCLTADH